VDASQKTDMVTRGVYGFCRNPAFLGFDLLYIGSALACPNVVLLIAAPVGVLLLHLQILEEERYLAKAFGEDYARYRAGVKRYCPWF
jgi:protein-S-isoprenylcysteine O-methyltransferase Ste14